jgi:hypothetical protein
MMLRGFAAGLPTRRKYQRPHWHSRSRDTSGITSWCWKSAIFRCYREANPYGFCKDAESEKFGACLSALPAGPRFVPALLLFAWARVHVSMIFRSRHIFTTQKIQVGKHRRQLGFLQGTTTNTDGGSSLRFVEGNENGRPAAAGIRTVPMVTGLFCHKNLQLIRGLQPLAVKQRTSED